MNASQPAGLVPHASTCKTWDGPKWLQGGGQEGVSGHPCAGLAGGQVVTSSRQGGSQKGTRRPDLLHSGDHLMERAVLILVMAVGLAARAPEQCLGEPVWNSPTGG